MAFGSSQIGNLSVNLTMDTAAFQKGATIAEKRAAGLNKKVSAMSGTFKTFAVGFAGGIAAGLVPAISGVISNAFQMASSLDEASKKVGVTVEALQELRFAATQNNISNEQLDITLTRMNRSLGQLQLGSKSAVTAFQRIGLSAEELKGKSPEEAMRLINDGLNKIPDAAIRAATGQEIYGRAFATFLPLVEGGSAALDKYAEASRNQGQISTEDAKKLDELADGWDRLKIRIGVATVNIVSGIAKGATGVTNFIKSFWKLRDDAIASFHAMRDRSVKAVVDMVNGIGNAISNKLSSIWNGAKAKIDQVTGWFKGMYDAVVGHSYVPDMVNEIGVTMAKLQEKMVDPAKKATDSTKEVFEQLRSDLHSLLSDLFPEVTADNAFVEKVNTLDRALAKGLITLREYSAAIERLAQQDLGDPEILGGQSSQQLADEMTEGLGELKDDVIPEFGEQVKLTTAQVIEGFGAMAAGAIGATRSMVDTFKSGDILGGIQQFLELVLNVVRALGQIGVIKLPGGDIPTPRAGGGPVSPGRSYLVGEQGPEVVSFGRRGFVSPNKNNNKQMKILVEASPYFDVRVDGRVIAVAGPMSAQAAMLGAAGGQTSAARQSRRRIP